MKKKKRNKEKGKKKAKVSHFTRVASSPVEGQPQSDKAGFSHTLHDVCDGDKTMIRESNGFDSRALPGATTVGQEKEKQVWHASGDHAPTACWVSFFFLVAA